MEWRRHERTATQWRRETLDYVAAVNAFVEEGLRRGWAEAGPEPEDPRTTELAERVIAAVREANAAGAWRELRERLPVAHAPFVPLLKDRAQSIHSLAWVDDDRVAATIGAPWQETRVVLFGTDGETEELPGVDAVGRLGSRLAVARGDGIELLDHWGAAPTRRVPMPTGTEGIDAPPGMRVEPAPRILESLQPLPDGALVVLHAGVFASTGAGVRRLFPHPRMLKAMLRTWADEGETSFSPDFDMIHGAVSPDGALVACGSQDSQHLLLTPTGRLVARFGPLHSSYPHHAAFSDDGVYACFNACHFYNGVTVAGAVDQLRRLDLGEYTDDRRLHVLDRELRVYASAWLGDAFALGGAYGYVRAVAPGGFEQWRQFVGSTVGGLALSPDGRTLAVGTAAGFLSLLDLAPKEPDPALIGTGGLAERLRYVAWRDEPIWRW